MCILFVTYPPESKIRLPLLRLVKDKKIHSVLEAEKYRALCKNRRSPPDFLILVFSELDNLKRLA